MAGSLFERLTLGQEEAVPNEDVSIRNNLSRILGMHQGAVQALPDCGLPDFNDLRMSRSELQMALCTAIEHNILCYEPRLCKPSVTSLPQSADAPFTMFFSIQATKVGPNGKTPWTWDVSIDGGKLRE